MAKSIKDELRNVISGKSEVRYGGIIQTITRYLENCARASEETRGTKQFKEQEAKVLIQLADQENFWLTIDPKQYVSEGAEQKVFLHNETTVSKLNDSIYYETWRDYFINLLLHNFFFPDTAYKLVGFTKIGQTLFAVVEQSFILSKAATDLGQVKTFLASNGFENNRNNDYINKELGLIIEDLHDENVLTKNGILYFIDTVFYLTDDFDT